MGDGIARMDGDDDGKRAEKESRGAVQGEGGERAERIGKSIRDCPRLASSQWSFPCFVALADPAQCGLCHVAGRLAGGIGVALDPAMNLFQWDRVATVLLAIFAVVIVAEIAVTYIRKKNHLRALRM